MRLDCLVLSFLLPSTRTRNVDYFLTMDTIGLTGTIGTWVAVFITILALVGVVRPILGWCASRTESQIALKAVDSGLPTTRSSILAALCLTSRCFKGSPGVDEGCCCNQPLSYKLDESAILQMLLTRPTQPIIVSVIIPISLDTPELKEKMMQIYGNRSCRRIMGPIAIH